VREGEEGKEGKEERRKGREGRERREGREGREERRERRKRKIVERRIQKKYTPIISAKQSPGVFVGVRRKFSILESPVLISLMSDFMADNFCFAASFIPRSS
jgi:hypothetical protein